MFDYLIVGAGFAGSILAERLATVENKKVLLIDTAEGDPYYPIPRPEKAEIYKKCKALADASDTYFVGRLATYKYYNMDQVVAQALHTFKKIRSETAAKITTNEVAA